MFRNKVVKNASWIIVCKVFQSVLSFIVGLFTARYLGPSNFGVISYADSLVVFVLPIMQLGINNILVHEIVEHENEDGEIMGTTLVLCSLSSVLCMASIFVFSIVVNSDETETIIVCSLYSIALFFQALELLQFWFQAKYLSKYTSLIMLIAYFTKSCYRIFLLATGKSIYWFAVANSVDYFIIVIGLFFLFGRKANTKFSFSIDTAKRLIHKGHYYIISSMMVTIFAQTDRIMLKFMLGNFETGLYAAATTCAGITGFVFVAIIDSLRPLVFERRKESKEQAEEVVSLTYCLIIYGSLAQCLAMTIFAKPLITIIYGDAYVASVSALQIVVWYTTFSYLGAVRNIWMLMEDKQRYLWIINLMGALANVVMNYFFITFWGVNGAALASLVTQFFTNVLVGYILKPIRKNNELMVKGMNPKILLRVAKSITV